MNIFILLAAVLLSTYGGVSAETCSLPCQMTCYMDNPSEIKAALGNNPVLDAILPDAFEYGPAIREAAASFPIAGGFFKGSELKGTLLKEATDSTIKVLSACGLMAVDADKEYIAFKIGKGKLPLPVAIGPQSQEVCAAVQICDGSILLGLRGFKVDIATPLGKAVMGPTAFGLSAKGGLSETSRAPLWFGGAIASNTKTVNGHLHLAGFLQWSLGEPGILSFNLRADASFIMNLQPDTSKPMVVPSFDGVASGLANMETLISVGVAPNIEVLNIIRIDLSQFLGSAQASVYLSTLGEGASFETAVAFVAKVKPFAVLGALGFGDGLTTKIIEELVDNIQINGKLQFFVSHVDGKSKTTEWGLRLEGSVGVKKSDETKNVKDPKINAISVTGGTGKRTTIALWNQNNKRVLAISLCNSEANCPDDEYCDLTFGKCTKKVGRGTPCLVNKVCKDRFTCVRGFCNRKCSEGCNDSEFCDSTFDVCAPKVGKGSPCVQDKVCSGNLVCKVGFCSAGCKNDASCPSDQFCEPVARTCKKKLSRGTACTASSMCQSRFTCVRGFCNRKCDKGCSSSEFCDSTFDVCAPKVGKGSVCVEDKVCKSGLVCKLGSCQSGCRNDAECGTGKFCDRTFRTCSNRVGRGKPCLQSFTCQERFSCHAGFCNRRCNKGCSSDEFCDAFNNCVNRKKKNKACLKNKECKSKKCRFFKCK